MGSHLILKSQEKLYIILYLIQLRTLYLKYLCFSTSLLYGLFFHYYLLKLKIRIFILDVLEDFQSLIRNTAVILAWGVRESTLFFFQCRCYSWRKTSKPFLLSFFFFFFKSYNNSFKIKSVDLVFYHLEDFINSLILMAVIYNLYFIINFKT